MTTRASTTSHHGEFVRKLVSGTMMCSVHQLVIASEVCCTFSSIHRSAEFTGPAMGCTQPSWKVFAQTYCWPSTTPTTTRTAPAA